MADEKPFRIHVVGLLGDVSFHTIKYCAEDLHEKDPELYPLPKIECLLEFDWDLYIESKRRELKGDVWSFDDKVVSYVNGELIGDSTAMLRWAEGDHNYRNYRPKALLETLAESAYVEYLNTKRHDYVFMHINIDDKYIGKMTIELFSDMLPKTSENFRALCTGEKGESPDTEYRLHYKDSTVHRVVKNGWIQGGDIWMKRGDGGESIYGTVFQDENFAVKHDRRGIVGMANKGRHTNGSQFYITLQPAKWMDTKYVAFGRVIEGTQVLKAIEELETMNDRPLKEVSITDCGVSVFEF